MRRILYNKIVHDGWRETDEAQLGEFAVFIFAWHVCHDGSEPGVQLLLHLFYVDTLGLGIGLASLARTVFLIWDAVNNPLMGYWSDRTKTRLGRRRPWVFGAIPLFMLTFVLVFSPPEGLSENGLFMWFLVALILYEAVATVLWVNYGALFPELFRGDRIRAKASAIQQGYQVVALLIGTALTPIIYDAMGFRVWRFCTRRCSAYLCSSA